MTAACPRCGFDPAATITEPPLGCDRCERPTRHGYAGPGEPRPFRAWVLGNADVELAAMVTPQLWRRVACGQARGWGLEWKAAPATAGSAAR